MKNKHGADENYEVHSSRGGKVKNNGNDRGKRDKVHGI